MNNRNAWLGALFLFGWLVLLMKGLDMYKPEVTDGIVNYVLSLDADARIVFIGWVLSLAVFFALACYFFAPSRKRTDNSSAAE